MITATETDAVAEVLAEYPNAGRDSLIPILQDVQDRCGYLSRESIALIGKHLRLPASKIYGVATFYNQFRFSKLGRFHVQLCRGTACHVKGSLSLMDVLKQELGILPGQTTKDGVFSLEVVACIGACGLAPVMAVNGEFHACMTSQMVRQIIENYRQEAKTHE